MSAKTFTEEFKIEAVKQINEQGYPVSEVAARLGVSTNSLYAWIKRYQKPEPQRKQGDALQHEVKRHRQELKRVTEERSQTGYRKRRYYGGGMPSVASPNYLERQFIVPLIGCVT